MVLERKRSKDVLSTIKNRQMEMIRRKYLNYTKNKWVLWIVSDFYMKYNFEKITASIQVKKKDNSVIDISKIVRTPYYNKSIYQISMTAGSKRLFGIPLVFDYFEELSKINQVSIKWDLYFYSELGEKHIPNVATVNVVHNLTFDSELLPDQHIFTLSSYDDILDFVSGEKHHVTDEYYKKFDIAFLLPGEIIRDEKENDWIYKYFPEKILWPKCEYGYFDKNTPCNEKEKNTVNQILLEDIYIPNMSIIDKMINRANTSKTCNHYIVYREENVTLVSNEIADIIPEVGFEFANS